MTPTQSNNDMEDTRGSRPVPDPTELTDRAIARLRSEMTSYIDGQLAVRDERLAAIDEATRLRLVAVTDIPHQIESAVGRLAEVTNERFSGIATQFRERDDRSKRESELNKIALDAAFSASKEAVAAAFAAQKEDANRRDEANGKAIDKSERATAETIKTNQELGTTQLGALGKGLDEVKERVTRIESNKQGAVENKTGLYATVGIIISIIVFGMGVLTFIATRPPV